jgi:hypothetical protein
MGQTTFDSRYYDNFVTNLPYHFLQELETTPPDMVRSLFASRPWNPAEGDRVSFDSFALPSYGRRALGENASAPIIGVTEGDTMTVKQVEYHAKTQITTRADHFAKENITEKLSRSLVRSLINIEDLEMCAKIFNDAEDTTYTPVDGTVVDWVCADDLALASATHTVNGTGATTYSNLYATAAKLSTSDLVLVMRQGVDNTVNDEGLPIPVSYNTLLIGPDPAMLKKAFEIYGTPKDPGTANNAANIFYAGGDFNMRIVQLKKGDLGPDGKKRNTATAKYRFALIDSNYQENWQYSQAKEAGVILKDSDIDTVLKVAVANKFSAFATVRWQGYILANNTTAPSTVD